MGVDVREVSSDACTPLASLHLYPLIISCRTRSTADVVESKLRNARVELHQHGERLADAAGGTEDGDLGVLATLSGCILYICQVAIDSNDVATVNGCCCGCTTRLTC